jgi:hypothetical protein
MIAEVHGVTGIRATLVPHDPVRPFGEDVDQLAFPFVAPLGANDDDGAIRPSEHGVGWEVWRKKNTPRRIARGVE